MKPFAEAFDSAWTWKRPRLWHRRFELHAGEHVLAVLESRSLLGSAMAGESAGAHWRLSHEGLLRGRVHVSNTAETEDAAVFHPRWFGAGDVSTRRGQVLRWHRADFWGRRWELVDSGGLTRLAFERSPAMLSLDARVEVAEASRADPELEPLVLLGFYLLLLMARQSHAAL